MIRNFLIAINFLLLFSCQNNSVSVMTKPPYKNIEKTVTKQTIKLEKYHDSRPKDIEVYKSFAVEVPPKFPGGIQKFQAFIKKNYVTPQEIIRDEASGGVFASFIIEKDGSVSNIKVLHDFGYGSGKELERVLKLSPNWIPAIKDGNPVRCLYSVPYYVH
ncbi:Gram-negative bacterial tonB protein [compost metagenome]